MDMTQLWMLCVVIAMVFFTVLQGVWWTMGKENRRKFAEQQAQQDQGKQKS